ncbi:MFS transporter [Paenibacillus rhizoplanae]
MPLGGRLFDKIGARPLVFVGLSIISTALFLLSGVTVDTSLPLIILSLVMMGLGMGLSMMPVNTHVLNSAPREWVNRVTPLTAAAQQVVVSFAVAGMTGYLTSQITVHMGKNDGRKQSACRCCTGLRGCLLPLGLHRRGRSGPQSDSAPSQDSGRCTFS